MSRVEEEAVAAFPLWICRIILKILRIEYIDKVSTSHCATWVTGFCLFYHRSCKDTDVIRSAIHYFYVVHNILKCGYNCQSDPSRAKIA